MSNVRFVCSVVQSYVARSEVAHDCTVVGVGGQIAIYKILLSEQDVMFSHHCKLAGLLVKVANTSYLRAFSGYT